MLDRQTGVESALLCGLDFGRGVPAALALGDEGGEFGGIPGQRCGPGWSGAIATKLAPNWLSGRGEDLDPFAAGDEPERAPQPAAFADPVLLPRRTLSGHWSRLPSPSSSSRELGDLEEPLGELALLDLCARNASRALRSPARWRHGHVDRIHLTSPFAAIDQPGSMQIEEHASHGRNIRCSHGELAASNRATGRALELIAHRCDVGAGPFTG